MLVLQPEAPTQDCTHKGTPEAIRPAPLNVTHRKDLVGRAKLVGAYRRRQDLTMHGHDTQPADNRITKLEAELPADIIEDARRIAAPPETNQN